MKQNQKIGRKTIYHTCTIPFQFLNFLIFALCFIQFDVAYLVVSAVQYFTTKIKSFKFCLLNSNNKNKNKNFKISKKKTFNKNVNGKIANLQTNKQKKKQIINIPNTKLDI